MATAERVGSKNGNVPADEEVPVAVEIEHVDEATSDEVAPAVEVEGQGRFLDFLKAQPSKKWLREIGVQERRYSPLAVLRRTTNLRHIRVPFVRRVRWGAVLRSFKKWVSHPKNAAFFLWLLAVLAGLLMLGLLIVGAFNDLIPQSSRRKDWIEANNQVLNGLFTIMCLYQHPALLHHLLLVLRWRPRDSAHLRAAYCKYAAPRRRERLHLLFVVSLLHITCFAQYTLFGLYLGYNRHNRPDDGETICIALGIGAPIVAGVYTLYGPLGRKRLDAVANAETPSEASEGEERRAAVEQPRWIGGLMNCWDDPAVACLSFSCTFCVLGWNLERLGFGNMFVHVATFALLCLAPFLVFVAVAQKIDDEAVSATVAGIGIALSVLGLLYGGFWRIQMRRKFRLPAGRGCCGRAGLTDCAKWLFCWSCALAQEVRTANFYEVGEESFYCKEEGSNGSGGKSVEPLPGEGPETAVVEGEELAVMEAPPVVVVVVGGEEEEEEGDRRRE